MLIKKCLAKTIVCKDDLFKPFKKMSKPVSVTTVDWTPVHPVV